MTTPIVRSRASLTEQDVYDTLSDVFTPDDEIIWISGGIWTFAHRSGWPVAQIAPRLLEIILAVAGTGRTILLSSYTFAYARSRRYDPIRSLPETGVLPQAALGHHAFRRTLKPINNYLVAGPRADEVMALPCTTAWGDDGVMGWVERTNARICMFGVPWHEACSFYHRGEARRAVPYRFYKRFPGVLMRDAEEIGLCEETLFVGSLNVRPDFDWSRVRRRMPALGEILAGRNPGIFAESATAATIIGACESILAEDPYGLLTNAAAVRYWIAEGRRAEEIAALPPDDRSALNTRSTVEVVA